MHIAVYTCQVMDTAQVYRKKTPGSPPTTLLAVQFWIQPTWQSTHNSAILKQLSIDTRTCEVQTCAELTKHCIRCRWQIKCLFCHGGGVSVTHQKERQLAQSMRKFDLYKCSFVFEAWTNQTWHQKYWWHYIRLCCMLTVCGIHIHLRVPLPLPFNTWPTGETPPTSR